MSPIIDTPSIRVSTLQSDGDCLFSREPLPCIPGKLPDPPAEIVVLPDAFPIPSCIGGCEEGMEQKIHCAIMAALKFPAFKPLAERWITTLDPWLLLDILAGPSAVWLAFTGGRAMAR